MPLFPEQAPEVGALVEVTLASGDRLPAYWDGAQWMTGVDNDPNDVPVSNSSVVSWSGF